MESEITGAAGAVANALWHATGVRVREFPITLDKLLGAKATYPKQPVGDYEMNAAT